MKPRIKKSIINTEEWKELKIHAEQSIGIDLNNLFKENPNRANEFTLRTDGLLVDLSKQKLSKKTLSLLYKLANHQDLKTSINNLFIGKKINLTENRSALHAALRSNKKELFVDDINIMHEIDKSYSKMSKIVNDIYTGKICGFSGKPFKTVINIGIGGSDIGPRLAVHALHYLCKNNLDIRFIANVDYQDLYVNLRKIEPETTLFIVSSKSFSTPETLTNASSARQWLLDNQCEQIENHFVAVTANQDAAIKFGIKPECILEIGEWIGGRYSLWSAIGLPIAIAIGMENFSALLEGAKVMDDHFLYEPLENNIPVTLALTDIWNANFLTANSLAIIPYDYSLSLLPDYLSQLMMESNGKNITLQGDQLSYDTEMVIWGAAGTNAQHTFFQLLHQGTRNIPTEFLVAATSNINHANHQLQLIANCLAQSESLMTGKKNQAKEPWRNFTGNRPSTTIIYDKLTPHILGKLLALYEHRTFVQSCIWNINAFDQWGVELGKALAGIIFEELGSGRIFNQHDSSTSQLINHILNKQKQTELISNQF